MNKLIIKGIALLGIVGLISSCGGGGSGSGTETITIKAENEPNDDIASANVVAVESELLMATIGNAGVDTDYYSFTITTLGLYVINPSVQCDIDQQVWLYDTDGTTALVDAQDNDNGIGPDNSEANCETIFYNFNIAGTYFFRVEELNQSSEGIYGVEIKQYILLSDETEPNDSFDTATAITVGDLPLEANLDPNGTDRDYFSFVVDTTGVEYTINPSVGADMDQVVWLYGTDGVTPLVGPQDLDAGIGPNNHPNSETITYTFTLAGTYYLRVDGLDADSFGNYNVEITHP